MTFSREKQRSFIDTEPAALFTARPISVGELRAAFKKMGINHSHKLITLLTVSSSGDHFLDISQHQINLARIATPPIRESGQRKSKEYKRYQNEKNESFEHSIFFTTTFVTAFLNTHSLEELKNFLGRKPSGVSLKNFEKIKEAIELILKSSPELKTN